jgi:hypothetical protein
VPYQRGTVEFYYRIMRAANRSQKTTRVFTIFYKDNGQHRISKRLETDGGEYYG